MDSEDKGRVDSIVDLYNRLMSCNDTQLILLQLNELSES